MSNLKISFEDFDREVLVAKSPVLVDFFATWCGPCKMIAPIVEEIAEEKKDTLKVVSIDVDEATQLAIRYGIEYIPTLILIKNGEEVARKSGYCSKEEILSLLG